jgi:hypothetical protein
LILEKLPAQTAFDIACEWNTKELHMPDEDIRSVFGDPDESMMSTPVAKLDSGTFRNDFVAAYGKIHFHPLKALQSSARSGGKVVHLLNSMN